MRFEWDSDKAAATLKTHRVEIPIILRTKAASSRWAIRPRGASWSSAMLSEAGQSG